MAETKIKPTKEEGMGWRGTNHITKVGTKSDGFTEEMRYDIKELLVDGVRVGGTKSITVDTTLLASDAGDILLTAIGEAITLPAPTAGLRYRFLVTEAPATSDWVITATGALVDGSVTEAGLVQLLAGETTLTIAYANALKGDWLELYSDGTRWFASGQFSVASSFTTA